MHLHGCASKKSQPQFGTQSAYAVLEPVAAENTTVQNSGLVDRSVAAVPAESVDG